MVRQKERQRHWVEDEDAYNEKEKENDNDNENENRNDKITMMELETENENSKDKNKKKEKNKNVGCARLLLRHVDDFIFYTTNENEAIAFAHMLHQGIQPYNIKANPAKTVINFKMSGISEDQVSKDEWVQWCGFQWNTKTLEVRIHHRDHNLGFVCLLVCLPVCLLVFFVCFFCWNESFVRPKKKKKVK